MTPPPKSPMTSTLHISATDLERSVTAGLAAKVGPKATASVSFGNDRIDVKVAGISKAFGIGPISKTFDLGGTIYVRSVPSPVVGCVALEWGMASFPEMIRPIINDVIDGALTNAAPLRPAIVREHSRSQLLVLDPAKLDIGQGPLGRWFNVTSLKIPGDAGAAISLAGTLTL